MSGCQQEESTNYFDVYSEMSKDRDRDGIIDIEKSTDDLFIMVERFCFQLSNEIDESVNHNLTGWVIKDPFSESDIENFPLSATPRFTIIVHE